MGCARVSYKYAEDFEVTVNSLYLSLLGEKYNSEAKISSSSQSDNIKESVEKFVESKKFPESQRAEIKIFLEEKVKKFISDVNPDEYSSLRIIDDSELYSVEQMLSINAKSYDNRLLGLVTLNATKVHDLNLFENVFLR
jgi:hypothetical protein